MIKAPVPEYRCSLMSVSCLENFADEVVDMCVDTVVAVIAAVYILPDMRDRKSVV